MFLIFYCNFAYLSVPRVLCVIVCECVIVLHCNTPPPNINPFSANNNNNKQ